MTNGRAELSADQEEKLVGCYAILTELAYSCEVPSVAAAVRAALVELDVALEAQALDVAAHVASADTWRTV